MSNNRFLLMLGEFLYFLQLSPIQKCFAFSKINILTIYTWNNLLIKNPAEKQTLDICDHSVTDV